MGSRGESQHSDSLWVDVPLGGVFMHHADSPLSVLQRGFRFWKWSRIGNTILQENTIDVDRVQPVTDFGSFKIDRQPLISAAGKDHYGWTCRVPRGGI